MINQRSIAINRTNPARSLAKGRIAASLIIGIFILRSLLAPGLVPDNRSGLTVVYCDNLIETAPPEYGFGTSGHQHASHVYSISISWAEEMLVSLDTGHDHGPGDRVHDLHCGLWTASGTLLAGMPFHRFTGFTYATSDIPVETVIKFAVRQLKYGQRHARAPPLHLIV